jgi:hypothetical protein
MKKALSLIAFGLLGTAASGAQAHHSFPAVFDATQPVSVTGKIVRVEWLNPHIWFYVEATEPDGTVTEWGFSSAPPGVLMRRGITKDVLAPGTEVHVEGFRARDGSNNASGSRVTLPDGRNVFTASSEDAVPERGSGRE